MRYISFIGFAAILALLFSPIVSADYSDWTGTWEIYKVGSNDQAEGPKVILTLQESVDKLNGTVPVITGTYAGGSINDGRIAFPAPFFQIEGKWSGSPPTIGNNPCSESGGNILIHHGASSDDLRGYWTCASSGPDSIINGVVGKRVSSTTSNETAIGQANPSCQPQPAKHLVPDPQYYPECVFKCEEGWKFDERGNCVPSVESNTSANTAQIQVVTPHNTTAVKPGGTKVTLSSGEQAEIIARCENLIARVKLISLAYNGDVGYYAPEHVIVYFRYLIKATIGLHCGELLRQEHPNKVAESAATSAKLATGSPVQIKMELQQGPLRVEVVNDQVAVDVDAPTVIVSSEGNNTFGVAYDPNSSSCFVAAYQNPIRIQPINSSLAPFTLGTGQRVEVSSGEVGPVTPINQTSNNGTTPGSGATGVPVTGNATAGNATPGSGGISAPGGPGSSGLGTATGGVLSPSGNNQIGEAAEIRAGQSISQSINPAGSSNFYRFHVDTSGILKLRLESVPADMKPALHLHDKNFAEIAYKSASNPGDSVTLEKDILGPGWFYIEVGDQDGKAHSEPYSLKASFEAAPDQYDPNPNFFRAAQIMQGQSITAYICPSRGGGLLQDICEYLGDLQAEAGYRPQGYEGRAGATR